MTIDFSFPDIAMYSSITILKASCPITIVFEIIHGE